MDLSNRTILITGGSSGIGLGLAQAFHQRNSQVIICGRDPQKLTATEKLLPGLTALCYDVGDARQREALAQEVLQRFPSLDILINNAGVQRTIDLKKGYDEIRSGEDEIAINFTGVVELTALFMSHLLQKPAAAVINVGSALGIMPMSRMPIYCATKSALHTYTMALRAQLKDTSVIVVEVLPPTVETNLNRVGRASNPNRHYGISVAEYIPGVIEKLESDVETIFHGDGEKIMSEPREVSETRLLNPLW
jgi:uncharacterized oxidoreductase